MKRCILTFTLAGPLAAQTILPPFDQNYSHIDLGTPPGVPANLGGCAFKIGEADTLYVCGSANNTGGAVYRIAIVRDAQGHITGFAAPAVRFADAPFNDGGLEFGPGGVLFYTRYRANELGMIKPGSSTTDKVVPLTPLGMPASVGALRFVPAGFPNVGRLKLASYNASQFATATLAADGSGTFDVTGLVLGTQPGGGPEGMFYVPPDSPQFTNFRNVVVCEYAASRIASYDIDGNGDPVPASRRVFMTGLSGAEGAAIDPSTGDFLFSTYGSSNRVIVVRGFALPCGAVVRYGQGLAGGGGLVPRLDPVGCFARRQTVRFTVGQGLAAAPGLFLAGLQQASISLYGGQLLVVPFTVIPHVLDGSGTYELALSIPDDTHLLNTDFFFQSMYFDPGAVQSVSFTGGVGLRVR